DRTAIDRTFHHDQRVLLARRLGGGGQAVTIFLQVAELQDVDRLDVGTDLHLAVRIEEHAEAAARGNAHVVVALRTYLEVVAQVVLVQHRIAARAFLPQAFGNAARLAASLGFHTRGKNAVYPAVHDFFTPPSCPATGLVVAASMAARIPAMRRVASCSVCASCVLPRSSCSMCLTR